MNTEQMEARLPVDCLKALEEVRKIATTSIVELAQGVLSPDQFGAFTALCILAFIPISNPLVKGEVAEVMSQEIAERKRAEKNERYKKYYGG